jgi:lysine 2-monooxygenase
MSAPSMLVPDFPFAYDEHVKHPAGLGSVPAEHYGTEIAVVGGGVSGVVAAYELMRLGLRPVLYERGQIGGRMRSVPLAGDTSTPAELGAMRFPTSAATLFHYIETLGLRTRPFPNPLAPSTPSTTVDLEGQTHRARTVDDLPPVYQEVADAWDKALQEGGERAAMEDALRRRDVPVIKSLWNRLVADLDDESFHGFLARSSSFSEFRFREIFGQVGFGTGGWDTDYPNSMLEILRVVLTGADDDQQSIVGGCQQIPSGLWEHAPEDMAHWPAGTTLAALHRGAPRPGVARLGCRRQGFEIVDDTGVARRYPAVVFTPHVWTLLTGIDADPDLLAPHLWTAVERTHYMSSSKLFVRTDRPFWLDRDVVTGEDVMSMTLSDRSMRGLYLLDDGPDRPGVMCLSYTWNDDSAKVRNFDAHHRLQIVLRRLEAIFPGVDVASHIVGDPVAVSWESEPEFMGAFRANLPGHYRYQRSLFTQFREEGAAAPGLFLCGDDVSWTAGFAEGAVTTALNAVWGVVDHLGGRTHPANPGPGDVFDDLAPVDLH